MCENTFYIDNHSELKKGWFFKYMQLTGTWIIMFTNFVPISLLVSRDLVKLYQGFFMSWDVIMYDDEEDMAANGYVVQQHQDGDEQDGAAVPGYGEEDEDDLDFYFLDLLASGHILRDDFDLGVPVAQVLGVVVLFLGGCSDSVLLRHLRV